MMKYKYLIVGGGMTADAAVKGIREIDTSGSIGIIGDEKDSPYMRPPLSKDLWTKVMSIDDIWCGTEKNAVDLHCAKRAVSLDPAKHEVSDVSGTVYGYDTLLLATGGEPRRLQIGGENVIYYRTCEDYRRLRKLSESAERFAVLGGGFIGAEIAAALKVKEKQVTMVFPESAVCGLLLPKDFALAVSRLYEARGITVIAGRKPSAITLDGQVLNVNIENGVKFQVDGVVAGIGITPNTDLAEEAGLDINNGIVVDKHLRTKDPNIFAAGDVANFYNPLLDRHIRVEHEDNALTMGAIAGRNMAGECVSYDHLPYFYSDLFDAGYEAVGETDSSLEVVTHLRDVEEKGCIFYMQEQRVRGVVFWNLFGKIEAGRELIAAPGPYTADGLRSWMKERLAD